MSIPPSSLIPLDTKPDFECCLQRIEAWFHQAVIDRPPVRFYKHNAQFESGEALDKSRWETLEARWFDTEYQLDVFERSILGREFHAETFPVFMPNLGPSVYSAFYAGRLEFDELTSWYQPVLANVDEVGVLQGDPFENVYFKKIEEMTRAALARSGSRYWVGYTDLHPCLDCVAAWVGVEMLFMAMAEEPEKLSVLLDLSVRDFRRIFECFDTILSGARQPSVTWMNIPCRRKFHIPSCDAASMISRAYFDSFSLPLLRREMIGIERAVFHVDGKGVSQHLDTILAQPDIQAIQWVQGVGTDAPILQWIPLLKRVLASGKSVLVDVPLGELEEFMARMPREGVFLCLGVENGQESAVLKRIEKW